MKHSAKTIQITDTVHGIIQLSYLEKEVISTEAFNRLHNVLQNSTAYLAYPANNTKRFEHSIGTMYLAGEIFYYSMLNADDSLRKEFLE